ncbi:MAG: hypothetical protein O3A51_05545 [Verrucomicrobia bacterium]|nr:hypothetical protein [Verrucomicrobiota bacterium]
MHEYTSTGGTRSFLTIWAVALGFLLTIPGNDTAWAQSSPGDLMDLSLEELLSVRLQRRSDDSPLVDTAVPRWSFGYRYHRMEFEDYQIHGNDLTLDQVLADHPVVPSLIVQEAHVAEISYVASPSITWIFLVPYLRQKTDHIRRAGAPFTLESEGMGDVAVQASILLMKGESHRLRLNAGLGLPTGSIDETGDTPRGSDTQLPYTMQLGSGTFEARPGLTYAGRGDHFDWGLQANQTLRLGKNSRNYSLGDETLIAAWLGRSRVLTFLDLTLKAAYYEWEKINGADRVLDPTIAPVANGAFYGGRRLTALVNAKITLPQKLLAGANLELEGGLPLSQHLHGPQPEQQWQLSVGLNRAF